VDFAVVQGNSVDIDQLETLWLQTLSHHRDLVHEEYPLHGAESSWDLARSEYQEWLSNDTAVLLIARGAALSEPLGYAVCRLVGGGPHV
jgi:hypothetical protein